jgi:predicted O-linked N-acetylglucosamine transferase (SPINDLY family)
VTLNGNRQAERMTTSMLSALGHEEWGAADEDEYVEIVARLAANSVLRRELRYSLRETMRNSPLCDAAGLARCLEDAYEAMFDRWIAQRPLNASKSPAA